MDIKTIFGKILLSLLLIIAVFSACKKSRSYMEREEKENTIFNNGYEEGYNIGRDVGFDYGYDEGYYEGFDSGYDEGYYDCKHDIEKDFDSIIFNFLEAGCHTVAKENEWHPEEALIIIDEYNQDPSSVTREEYLSAVETLCNYFEYFYYDRYKASEYDYID